MPTIVLRWAASLHGRPAVVQVDDLLEPTNKNLQVVGMTGEVVGLTQVYVESTGEIMSLLKEGESHRAVGAHAMNEVSSRSHSVLTIRVLKTHKQTGTVLQGDLNLVDLAGKLSKRLPVFVLLASGLHSSKECQQCRCGQAARRSRTRARLASG